MQGQKFATTSCPPGWKLYEKQCVGQIALLKTYDDARLYCQRSMNADLVVIDSQTKETFMETYVASTYSGASWIGLKDMTGDNNKNSHIWLPINKSVTDVGYSNWHPLEPNVLSHFCIILYMDGTPEWRDRNCYDKYYFICERPFISDATDKTKTDSMPINNYRRNLEDLKLSESASLVSLSSSIKHPPDKDVALQTEKLSMYEAPTVATSLAVPIMQTIESFANDFRQSTTIPTGNMQTVEDEIIQTSPTVAEFRKCNILDNRYLITKNPQ
ncbi:uncharacterized protein TRIADDRAFT_61847 [Trichoplax adhaerens]|uniref:C-type lectin domain-containing protein n=1 Tax=Trichoplax adhaerens TaxID=10228 RepID=B3SC57_TRIAD|nr:hypothetical protein TRIADDRAFT_61847 [Trichoplax adhaerens]EDV19660.1 hypothetical protein TRIADDRAFT_61847 [Trichoplax adhaerens]|eukprot:XP_002117817.1 hypothetical protein TRIADDRAFT_61847 [Trichoplax adhaerens]